MSIAARDVLRVRELIVSTIEEVTKIAAKSEAEKLVALNIDWFAVR